ncbi:MAG: type II secretion system protein [Rhodocyclales bacterium]|nr:type II secretion system protein [Rhodocyclales bacterium]
MKAGKREHGVAYLALLIGVAIVGVGVAAVGVVWSEVSQREKERELLFVGEQFRKGIQQYYESGVAEKKYPPTLEALLQDSRFPGIRRHLRQVYRDPMSGTTQWGLVRAPDGGVMGVYSLRTDVLAKKQTNFPPQLAGLEGKTKTSEWEFAYTPK